MIAGYHADLASEALGFNLIAFIHITLATHSPDNAKKFRALVNRVDDIQEAYSLTGDADYLLKAVLRDLKSLSDIVNNVLMPHQSVAHVRSSIVLDRLKESAKLPLKALGGSGCAFSEAMVRDGASRLLTMRSRLRIGLRATPSALILRRPPPGPRKARPDDRLRGRLEG